VIPVGLLGGSFDPVHQGHLQLAQDAQDALGLAHVVFVPAGVAWQKGPLGAAADRIRMLELALQAHPQWRIDARETRRPGPSYTIDTLQEVRREQGAAQPVVWIMGYDQLRRLHTWQRWEELTALAHIAYAQRPGAAGALEPAVQRFLERHAGTIDAVRAHPAGTVLEFPMRPVDCSATQIRRTLALGEDGAARQCLPAPVRDYVFAHQLYARVHGH
jgi:nicotinate-nucleotide adenylyltransferase